jgi:hypothetical protein
LSVATDLTSIATVVHLPQFQILAMESVATDEDPLQRLRRENFLVVFGQLLNVNNLFRYNRYKDPLQWL